MSAAHFRDDLTAKLRAASPAPSPCKTCPGQAAPFGTVDFNRSCEELHGHRLPDSGVPIAYRRCEACGLLFTVAFDDWTQADFLAHIYNAGYPEVDPGTVERRPRENAAWFASVFAADKGRLDILDYGGGNGRFAADMRAAGFRCETYDPFVAEFSAPPERRFSVVTSFETLEHMADPVDGASRIAALLTDDGVVFITTLMQPGDFASVGMGWWYIGPRNGHVTLFTRAAFAALWARFGLKVVSFSDNLHMVFRGAVPEYVREAQKRAQASVRPA